MAEWTTTVLRFSCYHCEKLGQKVMSPTKEKGNTISRTMTMIWLKQKWCGKPWRYCLHLCVKCPFMQPLIMNCCMYLICVSFTGCNVTVPAEVIVLNSIVLPYKDLPHSYKNEIILWMIKCVRKFDQALIIRILLFFSVLMTTFSMNKIWVCFSTL